jgi:hypothetical protein
VVLAQHPLHAALDAVIDSAHLHGQRVPADARDLELGA